MNTLSKNEVNEKFSHVFKWPITIICECNMKYCIIILTSSLGYIPCSTVPMPFIFIYYWSKIKPGSDYKGPIRKLTRAKQHTLKEHSHFHI